MLGSDSKEPHTTGSLRVAQLIARQAPLFVDFFLPIADSHDLKDQPLVVVVREAKESPILRIQIR
jgi:hypothetical protein